MRRKQQSIQQKQSNVISVLLILILSSPFAAWAASKENVLYSFCPIGGCVDGASPKSSLILDAAGDLYGTTWAGGIYGGIYGSGTVFELTPGENGTWIETVLHSFNRDGKDGYFPEAGLILDAAGNLYGTTSSGGGSGCYGSGCGTVFRLTPEANGTWTETLLHTFNNSTKDGLYPSRGNLVFDGAGNLYGTTYQGGAYSSSCHNTGCGTVFKLTSGGKGNWDETILHSFKGVDGARPAGGLIFDAAGNLYGVTGYGGSGSGCQGTGCGIVFQLKPETNGKWTEKILRRFYYPRSPAGALILDAAGNLYGMTGAGGSSGCRGIGCGTVFRLAPTTKGEWTQTILHRFHADGRDGAIPAASLIFDSAGSLYGTTQVGGAYYSGTVFQLTPRQNGKWSYKVLHSFNGYDGGDPQSSVIFDPASNLYGTTQEGGDFGLGTVFEVTP